MRSIINKNILILIFVQLFCACREVDLKFWNGSAVLTITNLTTGESRQEDSTIKITNVSVTVDSVSSSSSSVHIPGDDISIGDSSYDIVFKHGEKLQLKFTPPEDYKKRKFTVNYQILDMNVFVNESPYIYELILAEDIPVGSYFVRCIAMCEDWAEGSSCTQTIGFRVEE